MTHLRSRHEQDQKQDDTTHLVAEDALASSVLSQIRAEEDSSQKQFFTPGEKVKAITMQVRLVCNVITHATVFEPLGIGVHSQQTHSNTAT